MSKGILEYKSLTAEVKDVDLKNRTVTGYWAAFNNVDFDGDRILPGAFTKTIAERGPLGTKEIFFLNQHDWRQPLGKPSVLQEDTKGLYHETPVTVETSYADDALKCMDAGLVLQNSIGFVTIKHNNVNPNGDYKDYHREILEVKLYEGSCVTLGANEQTPFTGFKSLTMDQLGDQMSRTIKMLRNGTLTDDGFIQLEIALKQIEREYRLRIEALEKANSVTEDEPEDTSTQEEVNPNIDELTKKLENVFKNAKWTV